MTHLHLLVFRDGELAGGRRKEVPPAVQGKLECNRGWDTTGDQDVPHNIHSIRIGGDAVPEVAPWRVPCDDRCFLLR